MTVEKLPMKWRLALLQNYHSALSEGMDEPQARLEAWTRTSREARAATGKALSEGAR